MTNPHYPVDNYSPYLPGEPLQEVTLTIRFTTKMSPNNEKHIKTLMQTSNTMIIGSKVYEEGGKLYYEI